MPGEWSFHGGLSASIGKLQGQKPCPSYQVKPQDVVCELGSEPLLETLPFRLPWTSSLRFGESNFPLFIKVSWPMFLVVVCLFVCYGSWKKTQKPPVLLLPVFCQGSFRLAKANLGCVLTSAPTGVLCMVPRLSFAFPPSCLFQIP